VTTVEGIRGREIDARGVEASAEESALLRLGIIANDLLKINLEVGRM
jgi:hypothetical protein